MKLEIFKTPEEQALGLHKYKAVPRGTVFWFPGVQGRWIETFGFKEPIKVYFLDTAMQPIPSSDMIPEGKGWKPLDAFQILLNPDGALPIPPGASHLIETSFFTHLRPEFGFLAEGL